MSDAASASACFATELMLDMRLLGCDTKPLAHANGFGGELLWSKEMMSTSRGKILSSKLIATLFAACVLFAGCGKPQQSTQPTEPSAAGPAPATANSVPSSVTPPAPVPPPAPISPSVPAPGGEDLSKVKPDFKMTAEEWKFISEDRDERPKYKGKVIEVTGLVKSIGTSDGDPDTSIYLHDLNATVGVGVHINAKGHNIWKKVLPRQTVTLRARYDPDISGRLSDSQIISVTGQPCETLTVEELLKDAKKWSKLGNDLDYEGEVILTGKVQAVQKDTFGKVEGRMELVMTPAEAKTPLLVAAGSSALDKSINAIRAGQTIRVLGSLQSHSNTYRFFVHAVLETN